MMFGGPTRMLEQDARKARSITGTLGRLGAYFGRFWPMVVLAVLFVVVATWTQVTTPQLTGQATDCFLVPLGASSPLGSAFRRLRRPGPEFRSELLARTGSSHANGNCADHLQRLSSGRFRLTGSCQP